MTTGPIDIDSFAQRLWGNIFYNPQTRKFSKKESMEGDSKRGFLHFILEPLYKLYSQVGAILGISPNRVLMKWFKSSNRY